MLELICTELNELAHTAILLPSIFEIVDLVLASDRALVRDN